MRTSMKSMLGKCVGPIPTNQFSAARAVNVAAQRAPTNAGNTHFHGLGMSPTLKLNEMQRMLTEDDPDRIIYKFGFGQSPMPVPECLVRRLKEYAHIKDYLPVQGLPQLRVSIADHHNKVVLEHSTVSAENVFVTPGSKQSFFLLILALSQHTEVLLPSPSWVSYHPQSTMLGRDMVWIQSSVQNSFKIQPEVLKQHLINNPPRPRLLILNSPSNPTGIMYSRDELAEIADVCREHGVIAMSDEIYGDLCHDPAQNHCSIHDAYPEGTIITSGLSKNLGAGGWRLGYIIFPETMSSVKHNFHIAAAETHSTASAPVQYAACEAFDTFHGDEIQRYLKVKRAVLRVLAQKSYDALKGIEGCEVVKPDGGFYIFPDFSNFSRMDRLVRRWADGNGANKGDWNSDEFASFLLSECGVAGLPGSCFGRPGQELTMRLSYVDFDGSGILSSGALIEDEMDSVIAEYCYKTVKGMEVLADYMSSI